MKRRNAPRKLLFKQHDNALMRNVGTNQMGQNFLRGIACTYVYEVSDKRVVELFCNLFNVQGSNHNAERRPHSATHFGQPRAKFEE